MAENNKKNSNKRMQIDSLLDHPASREKTSGRRTQTGTGTRNASGKSGTSTGTRKTSSSAARPGETEAQRRERIRRSRQRRELRRRRQRRKRLIRLSLMVIVAAALVAVLVTGIAAVHRYRVKKAEEASAAAAAEEAARTLDTYRASDVLHLSFPTLTISDTTESSDTADTTDADGDGIADTATDADGDGVPDSMTDTAASESSSSSSSAGSASQTASSQPLTVSDFNTILSNLYEQNYVLVDVYSLAASGDSGFTDGAVQVPKGKKPLIISQADCSYTSEDDGKADSLVLDSRSGKVLCQYTEMNETDQSVDTLTGAVDVIPCLESFISQHPDFSYNGARGIIGVTGYRGLFGYTVEKDENVIVAPTVTISPSKQDVTYSQDDESNGTTDTGTNTGNAAGDGTGTTDNATGTNGTDTTDGTNATGNTNSSGTNDETDASGTTADTADQVLYLAGPSGFRPFTGLLTELRGTAADTSDPTDTTAENTAAETGTDAGTTEKQNVGSSSVSSSSSDNSQSNNEIVSQNIQTCQAIISTLRSSGWHFACNSYDLTSYGSQYDLMKNDVDQWENTFSSILGITDIMLFPKKTDIGDWNIYTADNQKYSYLSSLGFKYYFIENSGELTWAQVQPNYVRQGIHEIDTYADYLEVMNQ